MLQCRHRTSRFILGAALVFTLGISMPVAAEEGGLSYNQKNKSGGFVNYASDTDPDNTDGYVTPTFKRLSQLYWALAVFDLGDNQAIDNYLKIHECELYNKYFSSDFELIDLRAATRASIVQNMATFHKKFEVLLPLGLGRYDTGTEKFKILEDSVFMGSKRLEISGNRSSEAICGNQYAIEGYPKDFILSLSRPFLLTDLPLSPEVAQKFIEESQNPAKKNQFHYSLSPLGRVVYLRLKISISQFRSYYKPQDMPIVADLFGSIDGYEIYADREKTILLYKIESTRDNVITRRKKVVAPPEATPEAVNVKAEAEEKAEDSTEAVE